MQTIAAFQGHRARRLRAVIGVITSRPERNATAGISATRMEKRRKLPRRNSPRPRRRRHHQTSAAPHRQQAPRSRPRNLCSRSSPMPAPRWPMQPMPATTPWPARHPVHSRPATRQTPHRLQARRTRPSIHAGPIRRRRWAWHKRVCHQRLRPQRQSRTPNCSASAPRRARPFPPSRLPRFRHRPSVPTRPGFAYQIQTMCDMRIPVDKNVDKLRLSIR